MQNRLKTRMNNGRQEIFDPVRMKYIALSPEEWVRQSFIDYLIHKKQYPPGLISIENEVKGHYKKSRTDIRIYNRNREVMMIIECKAPDVPLKDKVFEQAARYNYQLKAPWLVITNGKEYYCARLDHHTNKTEFVEEIPEYPNLKSEK